MRNTLDNFSDALVTVVIGSDDFVDAVGAQIESAVDDAVEKAVENIDLDDDIKEKIDGYVDKIESDVEDVRIDVDRLESLVAGLRQNVETLIGENEELKNRLNSVELTTGCLSRLMESTRNALRTIPLLKRKFM